MYSILRLALALMLAASGMAWADGAATPCPGARACPIRVQMARGTDTIAFAGVSRQNVDCCSYMFRARAGQTLTWRLEGATLRTVIVYPNGEADGPGLPNAIPLPFDGDYLFEVHPNLMAEGAFGPFRLTLTIR